MVIFNAVIKFVKIYLDKMSKFNELSNFPIAIAAFHICQTFVLVVSDKYTGEGGDASIIQI